MAKKLRWRFQEKLKTLMGDASVFTLILVGFFFALVPNATLAALVGSSGFYFVVFNVLVWSYVFGQYDIELQDQTRKTLQRNLAALGVSALLIVFVNYFGAKERSGVFGRGVLAGSLLVFGVYVQLSRAWIAAGLRSAEHFFKWVFIADPETRRQVEKDISSAKLPLPIDWQSNTRAAEWLREADHLMGVVFSTKDREPQIIDTLMSIRLQGLPVFDLIEFYENQFRKIPVFFLSSDFFSFSKGFNLLGNPLLQRLKRLSDILIALLILIPALPVMALVALLIRMESSGPALFRQVRTGKDGRNFTLVKFRSMRTDAEAQGAQWAQVNDSRVTRLGRFLRKSRLDELPQLWNILKGEMSFVGPRPERPEFNQQLEKEIPFYQLRHLVRPGLTGWAQVHYPYGASIEDSYQKLQFDLYYVKNFSLILDLQIILKTIRVVVLGQGR
jgi:exopolysaccharide biosynthesis polyprenyl glycosylphosphotransferase